MDRGPLGSSVHGISQARMLEWVAILSSRASSQRRDQAHVSYQAGELITTELPGKPVLSQSPAPDAVTKGRHGALATGLRPRMTLVIGLSRP